MASRIGQRSWPDGTQGLGLELVLGRAVIGLELGHGLEQRLGCDLRQSPDRGWKLWRGLGLTLKLDLCSRTVVGFRALACDRAEAEAEAEVTCATGVEADSISRNKEDTRVRAGAKTAAKSNVGV